MIEMPHEEPEIVFCPELCPWHDVFWKHHPCRLDTTIKEPMLIHAEYFDFENPIKMSLEQIRRTVESLLPGPVKLEGIILQEKHVQLYFSLSFCPLFIIRRDFGKDWESSVKDVTEEMHTFVASPRIYKKYRFLAEMDHFRQKWNEAREKIKLALGTKSL